MRHKKAENRQIEQDKKYKSVLVAKFVNYLMKNGKKTVAKNVLYSSFDILKNKNQDAISLFEKAIQNVGPRQEVRPRRVGGASYQIPIEVRADRRTSIAIRWLIQAAKTKPNKEYHRFSEKLAQEFLDAAENRGEAIKKRDAVLRMAQANRAFAHFKW
ncbi:MAG: 30S ribosomal protein S7 [Patescibacteria group bacterium]